MNDDLIRRRDDLAAVDSPYKWEAVAKIEKLPTIEATPVRHGRWIDKPTGRYGQMQSWCSACGKHSGIGGIKSNRHKPYCPNCGADMREVEP